MIRMVRETSLMWTLIILLGVLGLVLTAGWDIKRRAQRRAAGHAAGHPPMADAEYLAELDLPETKQDLCLAFRLAMADAAGVPPETVYPSDSMAHLCELGLDGIDTVEILIGLEDRLGVTISDREAEKILADHPGLEMAFGDWVRCFVEDWDTIVGQRAASS